MSLDFLPKELEYIITDYKEHMEWYDRVNTHRNKFGKCLDEIERRDYQTNGEVTSVVINNCYDLYIDYQEIKYFHRQYNSRGYDIDGEPYHISVPSLVISHSYKYYRGNHINSIYILNYSDGIEFKQTTHY